MTYTLGLNAFHGDSSAAIYKDYQLICAAEEERFRRIKHWAGIPTEAIAFCLKEAGISIHELDAITVSRDPGVHMDKKIKHLLRHGFRVKNLLNRLQNRGKVKSFSHQLELAMGMDEGSLTVPVINVQHHLAHLASAFNPSPFVEAALLSIDGMGDFTSTMCGIGKGTEIKVLSEVHYPHSVGMFYTAFTQYLGFPHYGDEYKVMGLAPYGELRTDIKAKVEDVIQYDGDLGFTLNKKYFKHFKDGVEMSWEGGSPEIGPLFSDYLVEKFGPLRKKNEELSQYHKDLATAVQSVCEDIIFKILTALHQRTGLDAVCIAGGVAQNSVANGKILRRTPFKKVFVPPAGHDAGTAAGSALYSIHQIKGVARLQPDFNPYTGYCAAQDEIEACLTQSSIDFKHLNDELLFDAVCDCLMQGGVVGWYQGRAEFGPRALGNRSILADPRRNDVKEILNLKIKRRESFRPFAPSILKEFVDEYFEGADYVPFMEKVYPIREDKRATIPAVTHVDGSGRLQSVDAEINPRYHALISRFHQKSGVPILVNTSFNENEPIVNKPQEALDCFLRTKMDMLVLENFLIKR